MIVPELNSYYIKPMKKSFLKMHGLGNDFVVLDERAAPLGLTPQKIRAICDRRRGIGCDQLVTIAIPQAADTDAFIRFFNGDGSEAGACGNATRCIALLLSKEFRKQEIALQTSSNILKCIVTGDAITVDMGKPELEWHKIPLSIEQDTLSLTYSEGELSNPVAVNVGNPHVVFFVPDVEVLPLEVLGPKIEHASLFPQRINVEIAQVPSKHQVRMRVWERGSGITAACGTGACAVAVAAIRRGLTERKVEVILDGGPLTIEWRESDGHVLMTGGATLVYKGEIEI
jgi:diaminopimelate epimerase